MRKSIKLTKLELAAPLRDSSTSAYRQSDGRWSDDPSVRAEQRWSDVQRESNAHLSDCATGRTTSGC